MGYLQTNKQKHSTEANCMTAKNRLFPQNFQNIQAVIYLRYNNTHLCLWQQHIYKCKYNRHWQLGMVMSFTFYTQKCQVSSFREPNTRESFWNFLWEMSIYKPRVLLLQLHYVNQFSVLQTCLTCIGNFKLLFDQIKQKIFLLIMGVSITPLMELYCDVPIYEE